MDVSLQILDLEERVAGLKIIHVAGTKGKVIPILIFLLNKSTRFRPQSTPRNLT